MKTKEQIIYDIKSALTANEVAYIQTQDVLCDALEYVQNSEDLQAKMDEYFNDPKEKAKHFGVKDLAAGLKGFRVWQKENG